MRPRWHVYGLIFVAVLVLGIVTTFVSVRASEQGAASSVPVSGNPSSSNAEKSEGMTIALPMVSVGHSLAAAEPVASEPQSAVEQVLAEAGQLAV